ncbi:alpha/beta fold hydrolase, partial [Vibrio campbellii]
MSFSLSECHINKKVQLEWGSLAYRDYQPAQADLNTPTVVFLHGWLDNAASFDSTIVELIKLLPNIRCI